VPDADPETQRRFVVKRLQFLLSERRGRGCSGSASRLVGESVLLAWTFEKTTWQDAETNTLRRVRYPELTFWYN